MQDAEIQRRERELIATVLKPAEIERRRIEALASAERQKLISEAEGHASAIRTQGEAEAEIIFKKGEAEAKAMNVKAEAYQEYNQAAVVDKLITSMPEIVARWPRRWQNVDKITIVSTGGDTAGMNKITGDIDQNGRADSRAVRDAFGHADVRSVRKGQGDRRKAPKPQQRERRITWHFWNESARCCAPI